jgi:4-hydroxy-tetrahydrodipicolinate reductase
MISIVVHGGGRMAREVVKSIAAGGDRLAAVVSRSRPDWLGDEPWFAALDELTDLPDLVIDFTLPGGTMQVADWCRARLVPLVSGTTGLTDSDRAGLEQAGELVPVLWAPNLSKGLNMLLKDVREAAATLGPETAVEILDVHHRHKQDAPSGTALSLAQAIASVWGRDLSECLLVEAEAGEFPGPGKIYCHSRREGEVVGEHRVRFLMANESLEFIHAASDRNIYAAGSLEAGHWLLRQPAGLHGSADWLAG